MKSRSFLKTKAVYGFRLAIAIVVLVIGSTIFPINIVGQESLKYPPLDSTTIVPGSTAPPQEVIEVPIKFNVLKKVKITDEDLERTVSNANFILKQAGIQLSFPRINRDVSDGGNDDGKLDDGEMKQLYGNGIDMLNHEFRAWYERLFYPNEGRGYKVYIANELPDDAAGSSTHKATTDNDNIDVGSKSRGGPVRPVSFIQNSGNLQNMGTALAHEFCHGMTEGGHSSDINNLMYPTLDLKDTRLNQDQINEVRKGAEKQGWTKRKGSWFNVDTKRALWTDPLGDVSQEYIDLFTGSLFAEGPASDLEVEIALAGLFPDGTDVNTKFEMGFDTDNNTNTGYNGVDKILRIILQGKYPFIPPVGSVTTSLYDVASETSVPLTPGEVVRIEEIVDVNGPPIPAPSDYSDSIEQSLPLSLLGPLTDAVPVNLWATNINTGEYDWTSFLFNFNPPPGAAIEMEPLEAEPGQIVNVQGLRFPPLSTVKLLIDDTEIVQTTTLGDGTFSTSFTIPALSPGWYFVTAVSSQVDSLSFDFSILVVPSTPATFSVSNLSIQPPEVQPKEVVIVALSVANTGGTEGSYSVVLKINGVEEAHKTLTIAAGKSQSVSFEVAEEEAGSYNITVDGLSGSFTVAAPAPPPTTPPLNQAPTPTPTPTSTPTPESKGINWSLIGGITGGVIVVGLITLLLVRRRA